MVKIRDNGPGIAKMYRDRIFERLFRIQDNADIHIVKPASAFTMKRKSSPAKDRIEVAAVQEQNALFAIYLPTYQEK